MYDVNGTHGNYRFGTDTDIKYVRSIRNTTIKLERKTKTLLPEAEWLSKQQERPRTEQN